MYSSQTHSLWSWCTFTVSEVVRRDVKHEANVHYGPGENDTVDLFIPDHLPKGTDRHGPSLYPATFSSPFCIKQGLWNLLKFLIKSRFPTFRCPAFGLHSRRLLAIFGVSLNLLAFGRFDTSLSKTLAWFHIGFQCIDFPAKMITHLWLWVLWRLVRLLLWWNTI